MEVQVRVLVPQLYVRLDTVGRAVGEESYYVDRYLLYTTLYKCLEICQHYPGTTFRDLIWTSSRATLGSSIVCPFSR